MQKKERKQRVRKTPPLLPFGNTILSFDGSALYEHRYVQPYT